MGKLIILRGNLGSGKTTIAKELYQFDICTKNQKSIERNIEKNNIMRSLCYRCNIKRTTI